MWGTCNMLDKVKTCVWCMQEIMWGIIDNKSLTITNMQLIITEIRFCVCLPLNVWSNMAIRTCVRKPSGRIFYWCSTKREVSRGVISMVNKLGTLLCGMAIDVAELAFYLLSWPLIRCYTMMWMLLSLSTMTVGLLPRGTTTSTMRELTTGLMKVVARMPPATPSSSTPMSHETTAIRPIKTTMGSIDWGRLRRGAAGRLEGSQLRCMNSRVDRWPWSSEYKRGSALVDRLVTKSWNSPRSPWNIYKLKSVREIGLPAAPNSSNKPFTRCK